ncbi:uncharacterized protein LOC105423272 [Pogonomyrmex barbatus]|uniref:Uncharacterized protein LOC105423272 n=1 Tax=Pogonomyrmex barbatus TaxID=144034 RepID=A0A6I9WHR5_9HYME|nr:uncharacterized protein LOC105423272 [Pogonomyrmex barbatus]
MMLRKLEKLYISYNRLTYLPQAIGFLRNLRNLNVSNNELVYLPVSIFKSNFYLNIEDNPLNYSPREIVIPLMPQNLFEFSARIVIKQWRQSDFAGELPISKKIIRHLFDMKYCAHCGNPCLNYSIKSFGLYSTFDRIFIFYGYMNNSIKRIPYYPNFLQDFILVLPWRLYLTIEFCFCSRYCLNLFNS